MSALALMAPFKRRRERRAQLAGEIRERVRGLDVDLDLARQRLLSAVLALDRDAERARTPTGQVQPGSQSTQAAKSNDERWSS
jgi:hypothetical protein